MIESGFALRRYRAGDEGAIVDLMNRAFSAADAAFRPLDVAWWRWKYAANPAGAHTLLAEDPGGRIVGHYGGVPLQVRAEGADLRFGQNCDTCTDPAARRGLRNPGLFVRLAQAYASTFAGLREDAVMYGLPSPEAARIGTRYLDYWAVRSQWVLVCREEHRLPLGAPETPALPVDTFPAEMDAFATRLERVHRCIGRRDAAFLNWRFRDHPARPYGMAVARDGASAEVRGYAVWRVGRLAGQEGAVLMDWMVDPGDDAAARSLLSWVVQQSIAAGQDVLSFLCPTSSPWFGRFQDWGFRAEPTAYTMTARPYDPRVQPGFLRAYWYYTLADFDIL
jgi:hypothetical protein